MHTSYGAIINSIRYNIILQWGVDKKGLAYNPVLPGCRKTVVTNTDLNTMKIKRTVISTFDVIFTRPYQFDKFAGGFGNVHGFHYPVGSKRSPSSKAASKCRC